MKHVGMTETRTLKMLLKRFHENYSDLLIKITWYVFCMCWIIPADPERTADHSWIILVLNKNKIESTLFGYATNAERPWWSCDKTGPIRFFQEFLSPPYMNTHISCR